MSPSTFKKNLQVRFQFTTNNTDEEFQLAAEANNRLDTIEVSAPIGRNFSKTVNYGYCDSEEDRKDSTSEDLIQQD